MTRSRLRTKSRPWKVRASYARQLARLFVHNTGIDRPPMPIYDVISFAHIEFFSDPNFDPAYMKPLSDGNFLIAINLHNSPPERCRWSAAHECAHIKLLHHVQFAGIELTEREEKILDREADIWTREVLMPEVWMIREIEFPLNRAQLISLKDKFQVSWEALFIRLEELQVINREGAKVLLANKDFCSV